MQSSHHRVRRQFLYLSCDRNWKNTREDRVSIAKSIGRGNGYRHGSHSATHQGGPSLVEWVSAPSRPQSLAKSNPFSVAAIRSAKAYKYAYEAQDAAELWADFFLSGPDFADQAACGSLIPKKVDLIKRAFGPLTDVVDEVVPGGMNYDKLPCPAKGCRGCKGPKSRGNNHDGNGNSGSPGSKTMPGQTATSNGPGSTEQLTKSTGTLATSSVATFTLAPTLSTLIRSSVITTSSLSV